MKSLLLPIIAISLFHSLPPSASDKLTKESFVSGGEKRSFYLFAPASAASKSAPLIIMLHGSGRSGKTEPPAKS